jgi:hypothetical protein
MLVWQYAEPAPHVHPVQYGSTVSPRWSMTAEYPVGQLEPMGSNVPSSAPAASGTQVLEGVHAVSAQSV